MVLPNHPQSNETIPVSEKPQDQELDDEILLLLGEAPKEDKSFGKPIHRDLAARWQDILDKG